ncbi:MAG: hypothetical protein ABI379_01060 [Rhodanobacter sp.]
MYSSFSGPESRRKPTVALAPGSGGAKGLAHIGVIEELEGPGFEIVAMAGRSTDVLRNSVPVTPWVRARADYLPAVSLDGSATQVHLIVPDKQEAEEMRTYRQRFVAHLVPHGTTHLRA